MTFPPPSFASQLRWALPLAAAAFATLAPQSARAVEEYPPIVQRVVGTPCEPGCQLCHTVAVPESIPLGPNATAFFNGLFTNGWQYLQENIPTGVSEQTMTSAVATLAADPAFDNDANGINDITDLQNGDNPFLANEPDLCATGPTYGCGAHIAPKPDFSLTALGMSLLGLVGLAWRRRQSTRR